MPRKVLLALRPQPPTYFTMNCVPTSAHPDLALINKDHSLLCFYVEDNRIPIKQSDNGSIPWPHAQVVAHALGAYHANIIQARKRVAMRNDISLEARRSLLLRKCNLKQLAYAGYSRLYPSIEPLPAFI